MKTKYRLLLALTAFLVLIIAVLAILLFRAYYSEIPDYTFVEFSDNRISRYVTLYKTPEEMRSNDNCPDEKIAFERAVLLLPEIFNEEYDKKEEILVTYNSDSNFYMIFVPIKKSEFIYRITVDRFSGGIVEIAKVR